ncbi:hypothetical protein [Tenacibaculum crassostreae]|uniref:hypothetical protein n=1 Tax=Tenacibaculum crassostreae TaxID=502683 RepID=UPI003892E528
MKRISLTIFSLFLLLSCSTLNTSNKNIKWFENYEITPFLAVENLNSTYINELRFIEVRSSFYTKEIMWNNFGKWDKVIKPIEENHPILIWERRKLFDYQDELYTILAYGVENKKIMYSSIIILDSDKKDCLSNNSIVKDSLISYFSNKMKNLKNFNSNQDLYKEYLKMILTGEE